MVGEERVGIGNISCLCKGRAVLMVLALT
jgi:hypothetical protein